MIGSISSRRGCEDNMLRSGFYSTSIKADLQRDISTLRSVCALYKLFRAVFADNEWQKVQMR